MKLSIITVCYNSAATIRDTIESVLSQTYPDIEYIIIDGVSTDATMQIVSEYADRISMIVSEPDKGIYDAMNKGISLATGDVVGILNSDDFYDYSDAVSDIASSFIANPEVDIVFGDVVYVRPDNLKKIVRHYSSANFKPWWLKYGWMPPHPGTFVKRANYDKLGLYSLNYKTGADYEMFVRLLLTNRLNYKRIGKTITRMRIGGATTSGLRSYIITSIEMVKALKENGFYSNIFIVLFRLPIKLFELYNKKNPNDN
jgi:glycosyltransferase involved in cell wall biosynthesis